MYKIAAAQLKQVRIDDGTPEGMVRVGFLVAPADPGSIRRGEAKQFVEYLVEAGTAGCLQVGTFYGVAIVELPDAEQAAAKAAINPAKAEADAIQIALRRGGA